MSKKERIIEYIQALLVALLFLFTQQTVRIPNPFSIGNAATINLSVLALICLAVWGVGYQIILRGKYKALSVPGKRVFVLAVIFGVVYVLLTGLRYVFMDRLAISVSMTLTMLLGVTLFLIIDLGYISKKAMQKGAVLFINGMNLYVLWLLIANKGVVRSSEMIDLLGNINIYVGVVFVTAPILADYCSGHKHKLMPLMFWGNFVVTSLVLCFSGSRVGIFIYLAELMLMYVILYRVSIKQAILGRGLAALVTTVLLVVGACSQNEEVWLDVQRTMYFPNRIISIIFPEKTEAVPDVSDGLPDVQESVDQENAVIAPDVPEEVPVVQESAALEAEAEAVPQEPSETEFKLSDPDNDNAPADGIAQSYTRSWALERAKNVLSEYWVLGTGRDAIAMWGWGYQSSHNLIIDAVLCYGVFGAVVYMALWLLPVIYVWFKTYDRARFCLYVAGFVVIMVYSMTQPMLSNKLLIVLFLWGSFATYLPRKQ